MKFLYIGQYSEGTTSKMRGETLKSIAGQENFDFIDTNIPFYQTHPFFQSLGFRTKRGPLINSINQYIIKQLRGKYDMIWVDKAVFIVPETVQRLRESAHLLIHYTPDTAFFKNRSRHFYHSIGLYDFLITTKSYEFDNYLKYVDKSKLLFIPQGFDTKTHFPRNNFNEKGRHVVLIGLYEPSRGKTITELLKNNIPVKVAGKKWKKFVSRNKLPGLTYLGESLFREQYATELSKAMFGLGLLSKRFPELHTTRTFEIPACGTALITERNEETSRFFREDEVIFYDTIPELIQKINYYMAHQDELEVLSSKGHGRVIQDGYDYESLLRDLQYKVKLKN